MTEWKPIETAPKDGTEVILLIEDVIIKGQYISGAFPYWRVDVLPSHGCGCCSEDDPSPSHWMPLPPPPVL